MTAGRCQTDTADGALKHMVSIPSSLTITTFTIKISQWLNCADTTCIPITYEKGYHARRQRSTEKKLRKSDHNRKPPTPTKTIPSQPIQTPNQTSYSNKRQFRPKTPPEPSNLGASTNSIQPSNFVIRSPTSRTSAREAQCASRDRPSPSPYPRMPSTRCQSPSLVGDGSHSPRGLCARLLHTP